ncbi:MAG: protein kinase domain-containing protein [Blastococcus sp.]
MTTLGGRYELLDLLATGGMGQVWRGRDLLLQRPVAVKVLRSEFTGDPTFLARFRAEAQHTAVLSHRNIAALFDYGEMPAVPGRQEHLAYLVMELVEGESLSALLAREGRLDAVRTLDVLRQTAAALAAAHAAGVVHRDVKPGNVLVGADGTVKITDFGISWSASSVPLTQTGQVIGTAHYLSPEQAAGSKAGPASDVYALGVIGYECLAGRRPFDGENSVQIALRQLRDLPDPLPDDVPGPVRDLIARALVKDPADRFPDGAAFRTAVEHVQAGRALPAGVRSTRVFARPGRSGVPSGRRPRRGVRLLVPLVLLLAGAGIGVAALQVLGDAAVAPPAAAAGTPATTILVTASDYVGRPVDDVAAELTARGLRVQRTAVPTSTATAGTVTAVSPTGLRAAGDLVTVSYAVAPPAPATRPAPGPVPSQGGTVAALPVSSSGGSGSSPAGSGKTHGGGGHGNGHGGPHGPGHGHGKKG